MNRLFSVSCLALLTSCTRNPLPPECRDLSEFLDMQAHKIEEMQASISTRERADFSAARELASALLLEQDKILNACQAEIVARGMDCRQAKQASLVSDSRMRMRMLARITDHEYEVLGQRYVEALLGNAMQSALADTTGNLCK